MTSLNIIYGKKGDEVKIDDKLIIIKNNYRLITDEDSGNKYYEIENDMNIAMLPDILLELIPFTKYEPATAKKSEKTKTNNKRKRKTI